jgi:polar amino acid transport system permease protein
MQEFIFPEFYFFLAHKANVIWNSLPYVLGGAWVTALTVLLSMTLGFVLGVPLAVLHVYGSRPVRILVGAYVWFFRGVPLLLLLFLFYFGIFRYMGFDLDAVSACSIILGMTSAAYQSQIFRGAIQSLPGGQLRGARALGMKDRTAILHIILPQALRLSIPGWSNEYSILLKDSALCFALGTPEIMARATSVASRTYEHMTMYILAGILYFIITWIGVHFLRALERKAHIPGYVVQGS